MGNLDLYKYMRMGLKWWWLIILAPIVMGAIGYVLTPQPKPVYQAITTLMIGQSILQSNSTDVDISTSQRFASTYADMARRQPVLQGVVDTLKLDLNWQELKQKVKVNPVPGTQLLEITVTSQSAEEAQAVANEIAHQLIRLSPSGQQDAEKAKEQNFVRQRLEGLQTKIEAGQERLEDLEAELDGPLSVEQAQAIQQEISKLETLVASWEANYGQLLGYLDKGNSPKDLTIIESAQSNSRPVQNQPFQYPIIGAAIGLCLALGLIYLVESMDDSFKSTDDLSQALDLFTLGAINQMKGKQYEGKLMSLQDPFSPASEAYRKIRSNMQFLSVDRPARSIMVTSSKPGEGKSVTTANLGVVMALAGLKTIIVDTDLRRPSIHEIFQIPNLGGITDLLCSPELKISSQLRKTPVENLQVITCGVIPPNPSELLASRRMGELILNLTELADIVLYDSPPVLPVTDASILSNRVDGVILVVQAGKTRRKLVRQSISYLKRAEANVLGLVLNKVVGQNEGGEYYSYYHYSSPNGSQKSALEIPEETPKRQRQRLPFLK